MSAAKSTGTRIWPCVRKKLVGFLPARRSRTDFCLYVLFGFLALQFDFLGLDQAGRFKIHDTWNQIRARSDSRESDVAVVLWTDRDLSAFGEIYPLKYRMHTCVLRAILKARPRSVFVDVLFKGARRDDPTLDGLGRVFSRRKSPRRRKRGTPPILTSPIPLYLAGEGGCFDEGIVPELLAGSDGVRAETVPTPITLDENEETNNVAREYPLLANKNRVGNIGLKWECTTPALRMHLDARRSSLADDVGDETVLAPYAMPMALSWRACTEDDSGWFKSIWRPLKRAGRALSGRETRIPPECTKFKVIEARNIVVGVDSCKKRRPRARLSPSARKTLAGKFVVYGTGFESAADLAYTPIYNEPVPGAFVHAMALDNLRTDGERYSRRYPISSLGLEGARVYPWDAILLILVATAFVIVQRLEKCRHGPVACVRECLRRRCCQRHTVARDIVAMLFSVAFMLLPPIVVVVMIGVVIEYWLPAAPVSIATYVFVWIMLDNATSLRSHLIAEEKNDH
jgi:hypothetical protein